MSIIEKIVQQPEYFKFKKFCMMLGFVVTVVALILKFAVRIPQGFTLLTMGLGVLSVMFFFSAFEPPAGSSQDEAMGQNQPVQKSIWQSVAMRSFVQKIWGWSIAVSLISLLFWLQQWPGWNTMAIVGVPTFVIALALKLICKNHQQ